MSFSPETIFISYSRCDGREFAEAFERRLEAEGLHAWRDLKSMEAGDIRQQVLRALDRVEHLVLILSRKALSSDWIKREWSHARMMGKRVSPVRADPSLKRADLPPWVRREEVFDIDPERDRGEERWKALVLVLRGDGRTKRAPYMPGDLPADFVPRPAEYTALKAAVLAEAPEKAVALTTALLGAGGYGKTILANYLCRDPDVRFEFSDGIVRVEIGKERNDVTGLISDLIEKLDPEGKRPGFTDVVTASEHLGELIGESRRLLVIDDVWREAQLRPFLRGGPNCARLVTTRLPYVLEGVRHTEVPIDEMRAAEAARLIATNLPVASEPGAATRLSILADRLGNWAQMLAIANGWLRTRVEKHEGMADAIARFERRLAKDGPFVFDRKNETQRNKAIRLCIAASVEDLDTAEATRFGELAILPEDENVPLSVIEALWAETGGVDEDGTDDLVRRLDALSLLQSLDLGARTLRLHDNIIWYLRDRIAADGCRAAHAAMVQAIGARCGGGRWETLRAAEAYGWRFLIRHLRGAGQDEEADRLLTNYAWFKAKLRASGARGLFDSYLPEGQNEGVRFVGRAIALSLPALAGNPQELPRQLFGRLGGLAQKAVAGLVASAQQDPDFHPAPRWPSLTSPGAELIRLVGHEGSVMSAVFSPDGARVVTASHDCTGRIWNAATGSEITVLRGHGEALWSATFSPDGGRIVTTSGDRTARVWDATSGTEITVLHEHEDDVWSAGFSPDGSRIVTVSALKARIFDASTGRLVVRLHGSDDPKPGSPSYWTSASFSPDGRRVVTALCGPVARVWDTETGAEITVLRGHDSSVDIAMFSPDGARIVTASYDRTARIWDATTGAQIAALRGHGNRVRSAAFSPDGSRIVTAARAPDSERFLTTPSYDFTADDHSPRIWDAIAGTNVAVLRGHALTVNQAAFSDDGEYVVTASSDRTARIWEAAVGQETNVLRGHDLRVRRAAFSPDGARVVTASDDCTARIWDVKAKAEVAAPRHGDVVTSIGFSADGARIVTASYDRTARIWDATTGAAIVILRGHEHRVDRAAFSPDGSRIVTEAIFDRTARIWDAITGQEIAVFRKGETSDPSLIFSPDGSCFVTSYEREGGRSDQFARIWNTSTLKEMTVLRGHDDIVTMADFSTDGGLIVTGSHDDTARIWDATTGATIVVLRGHRSTVLSAVFSSDGARVLTRSYDQTARVWDATTGAEITALKPVSWAGIASLSPDGARIVTASYDRTARIWDATTGAQIAALRGHRDKVRAMVFSDDGSRIITASDDQTARIWDAGTGEQITQIAFEARVTALAVHHGDIAAGDALGRIHIFDAQEFLG